MKPISVTRQLNQNQSTVINCISTAKCVLINCVWIIELNAEVELSTICAAIDSLCLVGCCIRSSPQGSERGQVQRGREHALVGIQLC